MNNKIGFTFDDVLLVPRYNPYNSRKDVSTSVTDKTGKLTLGLPIFSSNMDTITESDMANVIHSNGGLGTLHRFMPFADNVDQYLKSPPSTFVSIGTTEAEKERFLALAEAGARNFCIDVAHGHSNYVKDMLRYVKKTLTEAYVMAGNVCTLEGAKFLEGEGADLIKVGIGPGSVCTTRIKTGFGVPQLTSIWECSKVGVSIVADGGIKTPGDIVKALAFGADFVMLGSMLSGLSCTPGKTFYKNDGKLYKEYRGNASKELADDKLGGLTEWKTAEGVSTTVEVVDYKNTFHDIVGGLRSALTYAGSKDVAELQENLDYMVITPSSRTESLPHKVL